MLVACIELIHKYLLAHAKDAGSFAGKKQQAMTS